MTDSAGPFLQFGVVIFRRVYARSAFCGNPFQGEFKTYYGRIEKISVQQGYVRSGGFYSLPEAGRKPSEAESKWLHLAEKDPVHAAASQGENWFTKFPALVDREVADEDLLWLDAGYRYGRVTIPLLRNRKRVKIAGVDASRVTLGIFLNCFKMSS
jgi:hypothetical protein